jgi:hypothetical protein
VTSLFVRGRRLKFFIGKWSPAPSAARAQAMREDIANDVFKQAEQDASTSGKRAKLAMLAKEYADTEAGRRAKEMLGARR